jgi:uncharacterized protein (DUF697 family)
MSTLWEEPFTGWSPPWISWEGIREEVERELQARILMTGPYGAGKSTLLNRLKGWEVSPVNIPAHPGIRVEDYGLFVILDLPEEEPAGFMAETLGLLPVDPGTCGLLLFVVGGEEALSGGSLRWLSRLRRLTWPVRVILAQADRLKDHREEIRKEVERWTGIPTLALSARLDPDPGARVVPWLLQANPRLAVALGREFPAFRPYIMREMFRSAAALSALTGSIPVPFLDLPTQAAIHLRLALRVAAMYDRLPPAGLGREELILMLTGLGLHYGAQRLALRLPLIGRWSAGLISGLGLWAFGHLTDRYFAWSAPARRRSGNGWLEALQQWWRNLRRR